MAWDKVVTTLNGGFESSSSTTPEFRSFFTLFKKEMTKILTEAMCKNIEITRGHFFMSGFFDDSRNQTWYFSMSDVRWFGADQMLIRTAESHKDYTGGGNQYVQFSNLPDSLTSFLMRRAI